MLDIGSGRPARRFFTQLQCTLGEVFIDLCDQSTDPGSKIEAIASVQAAPAGSSI